MIYSPPKPIVKKDGDIRIVVHYRKLNSVTIPVHFQLPTLEEIIAWLGEATLLSRVSSGSW